MTFTSDKLTANPVEARLILKPQTDDDRVSLHPLEGEDALRALLQIPPTKD